MSSLLHPVGHLPASVYWVRRGIALLLLLVLVFVLVRMFGGGDPEPAASSAPLSSPYSSAPATVVSPSPGSVGSAGRTRSTTSATTAGPTDVPTSQLSTSRRDGCAAVVDATRLVVTVTSGKDRIWTTAHCLTAIPKATLALSPGKASTTTITWDGHRSAAKCPKTTPVAKPGTYVVQATYDGNASTPQAFYLV